MYDCLLGMTARTVPDGAWRTEVVDVARRSSSRDGRVGRLRELVVEGEAGVVGGAATLVVPVGLVVVGGADARLAVAAAVAWSWRFVALDPAEVLDALAGLRSPELPVLLLRLAGMAWGVGLAVAVAHRSNRQAAAL